MSLDTFLLEKETPWYIYGYTEKGIRAMGQLREDGCQAKGFIDRNASNLQGRAHDAIIGSGRLRIPPESIIAISCQSVNTQLHIAKGLSEQGYNNLIFMAAGEAFEKEAASNIRGVWEEIFKEGTINYGREVRRYDKALRGSWPGSEVIRESNGSVTLEVPVELLYTKTICQAKEEWDKSNGEIRQAMERESDSPLLATRELNALFRLLLRGKGEAMGYLKNCSYLGGRDYASIIQDRTATFQLWLDELRGGMEYFIDAAASVEWNEKGYFNILDGCHRSLFLYYSGFHWIPVTMAKASYQKYCNEAIRKELRDLLKGKGISKGDGIIEKDGIAYWRDHFFAYYQTKLLAELFQYMRGRHMEKKGFLDMESQFGYFASMADKFGFSKVANVSEIPQVAKKGGELLYVSHMQSFCGEGIGKDKDGYNVVLLSDQCKTPLIEEMIEHKRKQEGVLLFMTQDYESQNSYGLEAEVLSSYLKERKTRKLVALHG